MYLKPTDNSPSEEHERSETASPFHLGVNPERLTPSAMEDLRRAWGECPAMPEHVRMSYEDNVRIRWNLHSNAIEGNTLTHGETIVLLLLGEAVGGRLMWECEEVVGHDLAVSYVREMVGQDRELLQTDLREWHRLLLVRPYRMPAQAPEGRPTSRLIQVGTYKQVPNFVRLSDGSIKRFAMPEETPALMTEHVDRLNTDLQHYLTSPSAGDFPKLLARQHADYTQIPPFDDGNGRTGRLITSWLCLKSGFPVSIIPVSQRDTYLAAMDHAHAGNLQPLRDLIAATLVKEVDFGLAVARGECDFSVDNEHADPTRPVEGSDGAAIITNGWEVRGSAS